MSYLLRMIGLRSLAAGNVVRFKEYGIQHLESERDLEQRVRKYCEIEDQSSFISERTFFYCSLFSFFMRCYGPPTPPRLKRLFLGPLRSLAVRMTIKLASLLIRFDAYQDRESDVAVFFSCRSKVFSRTTNGRDLICPRCRACSTPSIDARNVGRSFSSRRGCCFSCRMSWITLVWNTVARGLPPSHLSNYDNL
jgi:hypothetical protein